MAVKQQKVPKIVQFYNLAIILLRTLLIWATFTRDSATESFLSGFIAFGTFAKYGYSNIAMPTYTEHVVCTERNKLTDVSVGQTERSVTAMMLN